MAEFGLMGVEVLLRLWTAQRTKGLALTSNYFEVN